MKLTELMPMTVNAKTEEFILGMISKLAKRVDYLETIIVDLQDTIEKQDGFIQSIKGRVDMEHADKYLVVDSIFASDPDYRDILKFLKEEHT